MSEGMAVRRLKEERKAWRKDHPINFFARPASQADGTMDYFNWSAGIPGKEGTDWENGVYRLKLEFPENYPSRPPKCKWLVETSPNETCG